MPLDDKSSKHGADYKVGCDIEREVCEEREIGCELEWDSVGREVLCA